jgi:ribosomal protein L32
MNNHAYLQRFNNLVDVATAYNGQLHDQLIVDIVTERRHAGTDYNALTDAQQEVVQTASSDLYLATMFIHQSDRRRYRKLSEEFENSFTKGNGNYTENLVSAYHLINEYRNWQQRSSAPEPTGVAFAQQGKKGATKDDSWHKDAICHHCKEKGHICPNCTKLEDNDDEDKEVDDIDSIKQKKKTSKDKKAKKKTSFAQSEEESNSDKSAESGRQFFNFGFCTTSRTSYAHKTHLLFHHVD